ncbi:hypothetical protein [Catenulispora rubra]|uniref:hypothetical protein n=1 Tax=Catenulispora rubra TaxID=280293 RepID=UPI001892604D|nr:hypothetical protein [Catenulispora rubra]
MFTAGLAFFEPPQYVGPLGQGVDLRGAGRVDTLVDQRFELDQQVGEGGRGRGCPVADVQAPALGVVGEDEVACGELGVAGRGTEVDPGGAPRSRYS